LPLPAGLRDLHLHGLNMQDWTEIPAAALAQLACLPNLHRFCFPLLGRNGRRLTASDVEGLTTVLARLPGPVLELEVWGDCYSLAELSELPYLDRLRALSFHDSKLTTRDLQALARCTGLSNLRKLLLPATPLSPGQVRLLADIPSLDGLDTLLLRGLNLRDEGVAALFRPGRLPRLRQLWLNENGVGRAGIETLLAWGGLPRLRTLFLSENQVDALVARLLLGPGGISRLTRLYLSEYGEGEQRLTMTVCGPFVEWLGERFTCFVRQP
jgi:hypothetical protein